MHSQRQHPPSPRTPSPPVTPSLALTVISKLVAVMRKNSGEDTQCIMPAARADRATSTIAATQSILPCTRRYMSLFSKLNILRAPFHQLHEVLFQIAMVLGQLAHHLAGAGEQAADGTIVVVARDDKGPRPAPL